MRVNEKCEYCDSWSFLCIRVIICNDMSQMRYTYSLYIFVIKMMSFCHQINFYFTSVVISVSCIYLSLVNTERLSSSIYLQGHLRISSSCLNSTSLRYIYNIIIPYIFLLLKLIKQSGCFTENVLTRETTLLDNPIIYKTEEGNRLSPGLQPLTTRSVLKICFYFQTGSVILLTLPVLFCCLLQNKIFYF